MANWTIEERRQIWNKGQVVPGSDPAIWRKDQCGAFIKWDKYGDRSDRYNNGWEIDYIKPDSNGGSYSIVMQDHYNAIIKLVDRMVN